ncbi:MAG: hypothetical protein Q7S57_01990 [bacterium]|nr:hypothetical protein [bacterium]
MSEPKVFPRVSDENLLRLKRAVAERFPNELIIVKAFCWLIDHTQGLTQSVATFAPEEQYDESIGIALGFHDLRSGSATSSIQPMMDRIGNGFVTFSCNNRFVKGDYDEHSGGNTLRISASGVNYDEVEIPFDLTAIEATPLPE